MAFHSIVIPIFNEENGLWLLYERVKALLDSQPQDQFEVVLVNDGSKDRSKGILTDMHQKDPRFKVVHLARNFGHQLAITAGIRLATGDTVTCMDGDLQDPPELLLQFLEKWREGYEVIYAVRKTREGESAFKKFSAVLYYRMIAGLSSVPIPTDTGDFRLMDRKVVNVICQLQEQNPYIRGLVSWVGFRQIGIPYDRDSRRQGETHFTLRSMLKFGLDGITSFSTAPLQLATYLGGVLVVVSLGMSGSKVLAGVWGHPNWNWSGVLIGECLIGGVQLICIGILGTFLGKVLDNVRHRPMFVISELHGFEKKKP